MSMLDFLYYSPEPRPLVLKQPEPIELPGRTAMDTYPVGDENTGWKAGAWRWSVRGRQDWTEWFSREYNWRNFAVIALDWEWETHMGREFELHIALLGFHFDLEVFHEAERTHMLAPLMADIDEMLARSTFHV